MIRDDKEMIKKEKLCNQNRKILLILKKIEETKDAKEKLSLYEELIKLNNTKEEYILQYLLLVKEEDKDNFKLKLKKYQVCLSDNVYNKNFSNYPRKNSSIKIKSYIEFLSSISVTSFNYINFISTLNDFQKEENDIEFTSYKIVKWDTNHELYLYTLYNSLLSSMFGIITYYMKNTYTLDKLSKDPQYIRLNDALQKQIDAEKKKEQAQDTNGIITEEKKNKRKNIIEFIKCSIDSLVLMKGEFSDKYLFHLKEFIIYVKDNFYKRFGDLNLKDKNDRIIFEHFINFISSYLFDEGKDDIVIRQWNEIFVPLNKEQRMTIFNARIYPKFSYTIQLLDEPYEKIIIKNNKKNSQITIDNLEKYCFEYLIYLINQDFIEEYIDWYLNKALRPDKYNTDLFVNKKKEVWKKLLIEIFNSQTYNDIKASFYKYTQIDFFAINEVISEIIDNIQFFLFNSKFQGKTIMDSLKIYEYGIYQKEMPNKSIALLIFYGFHIIVNLHEIGGHFYARFQYFYSLNDGFVSPKIENNEASYYTSYGNERDQESGEKIEISLFGNTIQSLSVNEALYLLNINNYNQTANKFKENFKNCNKIKIGELIDPSLAEFLLKLDINPKNLYDIDNIIVNKRFFRQDNGRNIHLFESPRHPIDFYYKKEQTQKVLELIANNPNI